jgi:phospholipase/carboxylesterase
MRRALIGGLNVRLTGGTDDHGGGTGPLVILLHGFGAPGDDLVPLADVLDAPAGTRWLFPEGPLSLDWGIGDSRAWWIIDFARLQEDRAAGRFRDLAGEIPQGLALARERLQSFFKELSGKLPVDFRRTIIGGFSQGAMLTCDVVLHTDYPFAGLVQLSGNLLAESVWRPLASRRKGLQVFQSHGIHDDILPHIGAERLRDLLTQAGLLVEWHSFQGGHEIPEVVIRKLGGFLRNVLG